MIALDAAPGLDRPFGFERLAQHDAGLWRTLRDKARARRRPIAKLPIYGSDKSGTALGMARENLAALGLAEAVELKQMDVLDGGPPAAGGILVMNPPYGERVGASDELAAFYPRLGDALKQRYAGWTAYILTADLRLATLIGLKATKRTPLYNGPLECRLFEYRLVAGSMRRPGPTAGKV
jgi:putative N6-adenine-specific DNA methylase